MRTVFSERVSPCNLHQLSSFCSFVPRPSQFPATKRPVLPLTPNAKIPTKLRQRFLNSFIDEYLIITADTKEAYEKVYMCACVWVCGCVGVWVVVVCGCVGV